MTMQYDSWICIMAVRSVIYSANTRVNFIKCRLDSKVLCPESFTECQHALLRITIYEESYYEAARYFNA